MDENNTKYCDIDGVLFSKDKKQLLCYPSEKNGESYTIPSGTENVISLAFFIKSNMLESILLYMVLNFI